MTHEQKDGVTLVSRLHFALFPLLTSLPPAVPPFLSFFPPSSPSLLVDYQIAVDPKLKFYPTAAERDGALIHGGELSEEQLLALLVAGPDPAKDPLLSVELSDNDPTPEEIIAMLKEHNVARAFEGDENHSARLIFKPDFVPIED